MAAPCVRQRRGALPRARHKGEQGSCAPLRQRRARVGRRLCDVCPALCPCQRTSEKRHGPALVSADVSRPTRNPLPVGFVCVSGTCEYSVLLFSVGQAHIPAPGLYRHRQSTHHAVRAAAHNQHSSSARHPERSSPAAQPVANGAQKMAYFGREQLLHAWHIWPTALARSRCLTRSDDLARRFVATTVDEHASLAPRLLLAGSVRTPESKERHLNSL